MACDHNKFEGNVTFVRVSDKPGHFLAELQVHCAECGEAFRFVGIKPGPMMAGPSLSPDELKVRLPIRPTSMPKILAPIGKLDS